MTGVVVLGSYITADTKWSRRLRTMLQRLLVAYVLVALIATLALLAIGLVAVFSAMVDYVFGANGGLTSAELLVVLIKGVEVIFAAPLVLLLVVALARRADDALFGDGTAESSKGLETIKHYIGTLFISLTAAELLLRMVAEEQPGLFAFLPGILLILVLTIYVAALKLGDRKPGGAS